MTLTVIEKAKYVIVDQLKLDNFIASNEDHIYNKLKEIAKFAMDKNECSIGKDFNKFFNSINYFMSSIIQVGSNPQMLIAAKKWVTGNLPEMDAISGLILLTFIYVVEKGFQRFKESSDKNEKKIWEYIYNQINQLMKPIPLETKTLTKNKSIKNKRKKHLIGLWTKFKSKI